MSELDGLIVFFILGGKINELRYFVTWDSQCLGILLGKVVEQIKILIEAGLHKRT